MPTLRQVLITDATPDGKALFKSGLKIGEAIARIKPTPDLENRYFEKPSTAAAAVNACFRLGQAGRISDELRLLLKAAAAIRLARYPEAIPLWQQKIEDVAHPLRPLHGAIITPPIGLIDLSELIESSRKAQEHFNFRVTLPSAKHMAMSPFRGIMHEKLGLVAGTEKAQDGCKYTIALGSREQAEESWVQLFWEITGVNAGKPTGLSPTVAAERILAIIESKQLEVIVLSPAYCVWPTTIHDPKLRGETRGYFVFLNEDGGFLPHRIPDQYLKQWRDSVYHKLGSLEGYAEVRWKEADVKRKVKEAERILGL